MRLDDWHVDVAIAWPQKCLAGPPGMSLVVVGPRGCDIGGEGGVARGQRGDALALVFVEPTVGKAGEVEKLLCRVGRALRVAVAAAPP